MDVGFIGLGSMGKPMALNLVGAGHQVKVWNRSPDAASGLVTAGAVAVPTPAEAFSGDAVVTMLADDAAVRDVVLGQCGLGAHTETVHVSMSTISVALAQDLVSVHRHHGVAYLAAPVSDGPRQRKPPS